MCHFVLPPVMYKIICFPTVSPAEVYCQIWQIWGSFVVEVLLISENWYVSNFNLSFPIIRESKYLFLYVKASCIFLCELFVLSFSHWLLVFFFSIDYWSFSSQFLWTLYIRESSLLSVICLANIFASLSFLIWFSMWWFLCFNFVLLSLGAHAMEVEFIKCFFYGIWILSPS